MKTTKNELLTHTYFLCEVEREQFFHITHGSNDFRDIASLLYTPNGCKRDLVVLVDFDGILYPFEQGNKIDLSNPVVWVERGGNQYHLVAFEYKFEPQQQF